MYSSFKILLIFVVVIVSTQGAPQGGNTKKYPLKLQPELDSIDVDKYLQNEKNVNLQIKCAIYDGPCDVVGRWIKPRVAAAFLGECLKCTTKQEGDFKKIIAYLQERRPDDYKYGVVKFLTESGITIPVDDKPKTA